MKILLLVSCALIVSLGGVINAEQTTPAKLSDDQLGEMLQQAVMLAKFGMYDEAEARCKQILEQKPDQPTVKQLLDEIEQMRRRAHGQDPAYDFKRELSELIVPEVGFRQADPKDVFDFLRKESKKLTSDKSEINFVWLVPADVKLPRVTMTLRQLPFLDVVRYVTEAVGLRYRVDPHAVVIYKEPPPPTVKPEPNAPTQ